MDKIFKLLPKLFVDKFFKMDDLPYTNCGSVIKIQLWNKDNIQMEKYE